MSTTKPQTLLVIDSAINGMHLLTQLCRSGYLLEEIVCFDLLGKIKAKLRLADPDPQLVSGLADADVRQALGAI
jgi:hypothetical protein